MATPFKDRVRAAVATFVLTAFSLVAANDVFALDRGCRSVDQIKAEMTAEGQLPVVKYFESTGEKEGTFGQTIYTTNPQTRQGYRLDRGTASFATGLLCVMARVDNVRLFNNAQFDRSAFMDTAKSDKFGGINLSLYGAAKSDGENPIFRATETHLYLSDPAHIVYIVSNPQTSQGSVLGAALDGTYIEKYTKAIPTPQMAKVDHGAELTSVGKLLATN